jgi:excisionase family DNA binding protein
VAGTLIGTREAAKRLGVTQARVRALIKAGRLPSQQFGRDHLIEVNDLKLVEDRKPGRPRKTKSEITSNAVKKALDGESAKSTPAFAENVYAPKRRSNKK